MDIINVVVPPPVVVDVIPPSTPTEPVPPIIVRPGQGGARGVQGIQGVQGPIGPTPVIAYRYSQGVPASVWNIVHNLNFYPNITVEDSAGNIVEGEIDYLDPNTVQLSFSAAFSGYAYLS